MIHRGAGVDDGVGSRSDGVIGVGRGESIQKFIVWPIEVIFTGIGRDGAESLCNLRRPRSHFLPDRHETEYRNTWIEKI